MTTTCVVCCMLTVDKNEAPDEAPTVEEGIVFGYVIGAVELCAIMAGRSLSAREAAAEFGEHVTATLCQRHCRLVEREFQIAAMAAAMTTPGDEVPS